MRTPFNRPKSRAVRTLEAAAMAAGLARRTMRRRNKLNRFMHRG